MGDEPRGKKLRMEIEKLRSTHLFTHYAQTETVLPKADSPTIKK